MGSLQKSIGIVLSLGLETGHVGFATGNMIVSSPSPHQIDRIQAAAVVAFRASSSKFQTSRLVGSIHDQLQPPGA